MLEFLWCATDNNVFPSRVCPNKSLAMFDCLMLFNFNSSVVKSILRYQYFVYFIIVWCKSLILNS